MDGKVWWVAYRWYSYCTTCFLDTWLVLGIFGTLYIQYYPRVKDHDKMSTIETHKQQDIASLVCDKNNADDDEPVAGFVAISQRTRR